MQEYKEKFRVKAEDCISQIDSSLPLLLGTYTIVKWMEIVSAKYINSQIDTQKFITVGKRVDIEHTGMADVDNEIVITTTIEEQGKREVSFNIEATLEEKVIATAFHTRTIIPKKLIDRLIKA